MYLVNSSKLTLPSSSVWVGNEGEGDGGRNGGRDGGRKGGREKGCRERVEMEKMEERERDSGREELKE